jgi:hypothetical protein
VREDTVVCSEVLDGIDEADLDSLASVLTASSDYLERDL